MYLFRLYFGIFGEARRSEEFEKGTLIRNKGNQYCAYEMRWYFSLAKLDSRSFIYEALLLFLHMLYSYTYFFYLSVKHFNFQFGF